MRIDLVSLFPEFIAQCAAFGVTHRACERGLLSLHGWNPRDYAEGNYRRVDERTFGGGPGMVMMIEPLLATFAALRRADAATPLHVIYMSPQGRAFTQQRARELSVLPRIAIMCGRYEGVDERFLQHAVDEEISIGDYVLSGGELAAAVVVDAIARLQPGALGDAESASQDSFENGLLDCPHYTKPVHHALGDVPEVLLSGHHAEIEKWRRRQALERTARRRPDLLQTAQLTQKERDALDQLLADS